MKRLWLPSKQTILYWLSVAGCLAIALFAGWTRPASRIDDYVYDWMLQLDPPRETPAASVVLAIDDATLNAMGGQRRLRGILADAVTLASAAHPKVLAIDVILADPGDGREDARLEDAFSKTTNLILPVDLSQDGAWELPLDRFRKWAAAIGHVEADQHSADGVTRQISLETVARHQRYWALSLEAFRISRGVTRILESQGDLQIGGAAIPARLNSSGMRPMRIRYALEAIPEMSVRDLAANPSLGGGLTDKIVFLGVTSLSGTRDRIRTPYARTISGVEVHAQAFETMRRGDFLRTAKDSTVLALCIGLALFAGIIFSLASGWTAYPLGAGLLVLANAAPFWLFWEGVVFPFVAPVATGWLTVAGAASFQHFVVRLRLRKAEADKSRYQQAIHFVTHEMRTPLTAIQGSSELMGRYHFSEDKRREIAATINTESKRLSRMIRTFLDVERLSEGQMDLKRDAVSLNGVVDICLARVRPLAERKNIAIVCADGLEWTLRGDAELLEYAVYNLLNNAVKYSLADTQITVFSKRKVDSILLSIADQGIGMDAKELRHIFQKFYRTRRAEASGEAGTGIGLSIVEQIVIGHGGRMEVTSRPGEGSCFTMILPLAPLGAQDLT